MPDFVRVGVDALYSKNSDLSAPRFNRDWPTYEPVLSDEHIFLEVEAATAGTTVTTSYLATSELLIVKNRDTTNYVQATFDSAAGSSVDNIVRIRPGGFLISTDFTPAQNLVLAANSANVRCSVFIVGS